MNFLSIIILPLFGIITIIGILIYFIRLYNKLKSLDNSAEATLSQVRVALKKRFDTISQLLSLVKSYANFERDTFEAVTKMRTNIMSARVDNLSKFDRDSSTLLGGIVAVVENYPTLRASEPVINLMITIKNIEDEIARHRYTYNNIIQEFNKRLDTIPSKYIAALQHLSKKNYFKFSEDIDEKIDTKFYGA